METKVTLVYNVQTEGVVESTASSKKLTETLSALSSSMDLLSKKVKSFNQTAHKSSLSIRSLSDTVAKTKDELSKYGAGLDKIAVIEKSMQTIEKARVINMMARVREHKNLNKAIKNASSEEEKAYLMAQKQNLSLSQVKENLKANSHARKLEAEIQKSANAVAKEGNAILKKYRNTLDGMSEELEAAYFGVDKLAKVFRQQERVSALAEKALMDYDKAIAKTTASMKTMQNGAQKSALQAKVETMEKAKARIELEKEIKLRELWKQKKNEEATIRREAAALLKIYKEQVRDTVATVKGATPGIERLTESHRAENTIRKQLRETLTAYDAQLEKVDNTLSKATDEHARNAAMMKKHELEMNRSRATLHANTQIQTLLNLNLRQEAVIRKDAEKALKKYNDEISKTKNRINNQVGLVKKLKEANIGLKKARMDASTMESIYADKLDKVQSELDQTTDAEKRKALETKRNILLETQHAATIVAGASALELKRLRMRALSDALMKASQAMQRFGRMMTRYFTTVITAAIAKGVKFQAQIESQTIRFGILVKDMTKGAKLFQDIIEYSARTPFLLPELDEAAQVLLAFGTPLGEVMDELRMLGDVAQGDAEKLERVATSFGKVRARGTAHMRELNRFIMSGVPIIEELNKQFGATGDQIFRMIQKNEITFDNIKKAVQEMTGEAGRFHNMVETISKTLEGRFSTAVDNLNLNLAKLVEDFTPMITHVLEQFIDWSQAFRTLDSDARKAILTTAGLTAAIGPLSLAVAGLIKIISQAAMGNWVGLIITAISALLSITGFVKLKNEIESVMNKAIELKDSTKKLTEAQMYNANAIPGMTEAMYKAAKSYENYGFAVAEAARAEDLRRRINAGEGLTAQERSAFEMLFGISEDGVRFEANAIERAVKKGWNAVIDFANVTDADFAKPPLVMSLNEFKNSILELKKDFPEVGDVLSEIFSMTGTSMDTMTTQDAVDLINNYGLVDAIIYAIGAMDMTEANDVALTKLSEALAGIGDASTILENAGVDPLSLQQEFAKLLSISGDITIEGDVDEGLIDLSAAISRVRIGVTNLTKAYEAYLATSDLSGDAKSKAKDDFDVGIGAYYDTLDRLISAKITEMKYTYEEGNIFDNIFGTLSDQDMKDRIQENIKNVEDIIFSFSLTQDQLTRLKDFGNDYTTALENALAGGEKVGEDFVQDVIKSFGFTEGEAELESIAPLIAYIRKMQDALKNITEKEEKIDLFEAFFTGDLDSVKIKKAELSFKTALDTLADAIPDVGYATIFESLVLGDKPEAITEKAWQEAQDAYELLKSLTNKASDQRSLLAAFLGGPEDYAEFKKNLRIEEIYDAIRDAMTEESVPNLLEYIGDTSKLTPSVLETVPEWLKVLREGGDIEFDVLGDVFFVPMMDALEKAGAVGHTAYNIIADFIELWSLLAKVPAVDTSILSSFMGDPEEWKRLQDMEVKMKEVMGTLTKVAELESGRTVTDLLGKYMGNTLGSSEKNQVKQALDELSAFLVTEAESYDVSVLSAFMGDPKEWVQNYVKEGDLQNVMSDITDLMKSSSSRIDNISEFLFAYSTSRLDTATTTKLDILMENIKKYFSENMSEIDLGEIIKVSLDGKKAMEEFEKQFNFDTALKDAVENAGMSGKEFYDKMLKGDSLEDILGPEVAEALKKAFNIVDVSPIDQLWKDLGDTLTGNILPAFEKLGEALASGAAGQEALTQSFEGFIFAVLDALPAILLKAGLDSILTNPILGASLIAASGLVAIGNAFNWGVEQKADAPIQQVGGSISYSARGDVFNGGYIATAPTLRKTAYGASMVGEAGDEAVMPLVRRNGVLGVQASATGTNIVVNNFSSAQVETTETMDINGVRQVEFAIYETVKRGLARGEFDDSMGSSYGLSRRGYS